MDDAQVELLLSELSETRKSFDAAIGAIRWNRINTIIQYILIVIVMVMSLLGVVYYLDQRREDCERDNSTRAAFEDSLDANAAAIGVALATVSGAEAAVFQEYLEVYAAQPKPEALQPRSC